MNAEASPPERPLAQEALIADLRQRLQGARTQEIAARAEARRLGRELTLTRRLLRFFLEGRPPSRPTNVARTGPVPAIPLTGEVKFHLDACRPHGGHTILTGWAFCPVPSWDGHEATIDVILRHAGEAYGVGTGHLPRPDVAAYFAGQPAEASGGARGLDGAGFTCEVLNDSLPADVDLEIVLRLECAGLARERSTGQTLRL